MYSYNSILDEKIMSYNIERSLRKWFLKLTKISLESR
jgi:hypothetical protein